MDLRIMYFYYVDKIRKPDINFLMDEHTKYKEFYEDNDDLDLSEPKEIDGILDIYNKRKDDYKIDSFFTDIFYLIVDFDNMVATEELIKRTENSDKFKGWINRNSDDYDRIHAMFVGMGKFDEALKKIQKNNNNI